MDLKFSLTVYSMVGNNMSAAYLVFCFIVVIIFVRNYHGVQKKVSARFFVLFLFLIFIVSVIYPQHITKVANFFGVGRGSDFIFYNFIVFGLGMIGLLYKKIIHLERRLLNLNRQVSINETVFKTDEEQ